MLRKRSSEKAIYPILLLYFFGNCTFGSLGNSTDDRAAEWQALLRLSDERRTSISPWIYYSDDQGDSDLGDFSVSGGSTNYQVSLIQNSVVLESISFLFSAPESILSFGTTNQISASTGYHILHSGESEGSGSSGIGSYALQYGIQGEFEAGDISVSDFLSPTGPVRSQSLSPFPPVPYGSLAHIFGEYSQIVLTFEITRASDSSVKTIYLELQEAEIEIEPSCQLNVPYDKTVPFSIGFRTDGLLSSRPGDSFSILDSVFSLSGSSITVNRFQNVNLYNQILTNLSEPGQVMVLYSCL